MAFRQTYSRVDNSPESQAESSLEAVVVINSIRVGRVQGLRRSGQAQPRPVQEMGSDRVIEFVPGIKTFQGTLQSITITYGDLIKRLSAMVGGQIDSNSKAATITNFPEFDIALMRRGLPSYGSPSQYAAPGGSQDLAGTGKLITTLVGCVIETFEQSFNANESLIMESVSFRYIDEVIDASGSSSQETLSGFPGIGVG